jgi:hypothetical protein
LLYPEHKEAAKMDDAGFRIMPVAEARRALTDGDIRSDISFQNDVNRLLASLEELWGKSAARIQAKR